MIRLLLWLAVCAALAVLLRRRPAALGAAVVLLWTSVPASAGQVFTGVGGGSNLPQMHPAAWLALAGGLVSPYWLRRDRGLPLLTVLALVLQTTAIVLVVLSTVLHQGVPSVFRVGSSLVAPGVLFLLLTSAFRSDARSARRLQTLVVAIAVVQAGLGMVQYFTQEQVVYATFRASAWWYDPDRHVRGIGTADSPLDLSLLLLFSIPLVRVLPSTLLRLTTTGVLLAGLLATESRTATALGVLVAVLVVSTDSRAGLWRWAALGALGAGGLWAAGSALGAGLSDRISDDSNSTTARLESYSYFAEHWTDFLTSGEGWGYAGGLRSSGVLVTSPENAYMMLAYDGGLVCALALVVAQVLHLCAGVRTGWVAVLPGLLATVMAFSYSSFANSTASGALVWLAMAFSAAGAAEVRGRRAVRPPAGPGAEAVASLPAGGGPPPPPRSAVVAGA